MGDSAPYWVQTKADAYASDPALSRLTSAALRENTTIIKVLLAPCITSMGQMLKFIEKLKTDAWRTAGARYNAARRLKRRDLFATISLSLFSAVGVGLAVVQRIYAFKSGSPADNYITALSVCLGVFLLVISLIEWGAGNSVKADRLHQNAEELNAFQRELGLVIVDAKANNPIASLDAQKYLKKYDEIKVRSSFNHDPLDDRLFVATHRGDVEFKTAQGEEQYSTCDEHWLAFRSVFSSIWHFVGFWLVIAVLIWITPWDQATKIVSSAG